MKEKYKFTKNYIREYKNFVPKKLAQKIIYQKDLEFNQATTGGGKLNPHRHCLIKALDPQFNKEVADLYMKAFKNYIEEFRFFNSIKGDTTGWDHVLYMGDKAQEYKEHVDMSTDRQPRILTCSLILNDDYKGGDFVFFEGEYTIYKKSCSAIVFPSNFCFPHAITPVSEGDRHVIITWIR
tara:strand:+ start:84 stop:626 length:543 start_codon:yes stop_codon:yes gene_type:complete